MKTTEFLSIYAALLSTIVFAWNIRKSIPSYEVEMIHGADKVDGEYVNGAYIAVRNPSSHTVHLSNISILYPYEKTNVLRMIKHAIKYRRLPLSLGWCHSSLSNYMIKDLCPVALESGKSIAVLVPEDILQQISEESGKWTFKACVQDELWRNKYSRKFKYRE